MSSRSVLLTRTASAAVAGAVVLALVPAVAAPSHAATTSVPVARAVADLRAAAVQTRSAGVRFGSRADVSATIKAGGVSSTDVGAVKVDAVERVVRSDVRFGTRPSTLGPAGRYGHPCKPNGLTFDDKGAVTMHRAGVGRYESLGSPLSKVVKQGRRHAGLRAARWELKVDRGLTFDRSIALHDPSTAVAAALTDASSVTITSATTEPMTFTSPVSNGTRYRLEGRSRDGATFTAVVEVFEGGPVSSVRMLEAMSASGVTVTVDSSARYVYGPQTVAIPPLLHVIRPKKLRKGCAVALTVDAVRRTATDVAADLNDRRGKVTVGKIRRAVRAALRETNRAARVRAVRVDGGVRIVGKHKMFWKKRIVRRVLLVDGEAKVRKGRG